MCNINFPIEFDLDKITKPKKKRKSKTTKTIIVNTKYKESEIEEVMKVFSVDRGEAIKMLDASSLEDPLPRMIINGRKLY